MNDPRFATTAQSYVSGESSAKDKGPPDGMGQTSANLSTPSATSSQSGPVMSTAVADSTGGVVVQLLTKIEQNTRGGQIVVKQISGN
jgi:hypothetical protein